MKIFFTFIITILVFHASARNTPVDSLRNVLNTKIHDTARIDVCNDLARMYANNKPDTALIYAKQGYKLANQTGLDKRKAESLNILGVIFSFLGSYPQSMDYFLQSLKICEKINYPYGVARASANIAHIYDSQKDHLQAIEYTLKAKDIVESMDNPYLLIYPLTNLGGFYLELGMLDSARVYSNKAFELATKYDKPFNKAVILHNLGEIHAKMERDEIAIGYLHQAYNQAKKIEFADIVCSSSLGLADLYKEMGEVDSALYYSRISMKTATDGDFANQVLEASIFLSSYFSTLNLIDSAYYYQNIVIASKDSLFSQEKVREVQNLGFMENIRQQELKEARLAAAKIRKSNIQMLGVGTFITLFFILFFVMSKLKVKPWVVKFMGLFSLLLLFEFVTLLLSPIVAKFTNNNPVFTLMILVLIAAVLVPLHNKLQDWINIKLVKGN